MNIILSLKQTIKRNLPLIPFIKTMRFYVLEMTRHQWSGQCRNKTESIADSPFLFRIGNEAADFQDILMSLPEELFSEINLEKRKEIIAARFRKNIHCFVLRSTAPHDALSAAMWAVPRHDEFLPGYSSSDIGYTVTNLYVAEDFRGKGLSKILLSHAVAYLFENTPCRTVISEVLDFREASLNTHLRTGFSIVGTLYLQHIGSYWHRRFYKT